MSEREQKSRESAVLEFAGFGASEVEGKLDTVRKPLKKRFECANFEVKRSGIAPRTRVAKGEPSYASPNLVKNKGVNWNQGVEPPPTTPKSDLITQSPTTAIVKKGHPDEPQDRHPCPLTPTPAGHSRPLRSPLMNNGPHFSRRPIHPMDPCPADWAMCQKKVADAVKSLLADIIHFADEKPAGHRLLGNPHTQATPRLYEEIQQLRHLLERSFYPLDIPPDTTPPTLDTPPLALVDATTTKPSYSAAAKSAIPPPAAANVAERSAGKTQTKKPPQKPRLSNSGPQLPTPSHSAAQRLILRFPNSSVIKSVSDPQLLRDTLSDALQGASKVRGINLSRGGNLVLHVQAPTCCAIARARAGDLGSDSAVLHPTRPGPAHFHLDKPWQRLVIHHVPVVAVGNRPLVEELRWSNEGIGAKADVMGVRDLCSLEGFQKRREGMQKGIPQEATLMVMLLNADAARCFLREGVFLYGSHCCVSVYARKGSRR
ncbi:hypothetical protein K438DRAFT_1943548 [Mycena galopus ATCC 62051]|nr:hypothetical protein K438DRAFT_1943548 [Mycena galopus ATCC 62051]